MPSSFWMTNVDSDETATVTVEDLVRLFQHVQNAPRPPWFEIISPHEYNRRKAEWEAKQQPGTTPTN